MYYQGLLACTFLHLRYWWWSKLLNKLNMHHLVFHKAAAIRANESIQPVKSWPAIQNQRWDSMWLTSSFLHLWMFMGFSSSSSRALQRVLSLSSSLCRWYTSRLRSSTLATLFCRIIFSRRNFLISSFRTRISSSLWLYWISPLFSTDCWILIFSYNSASSSFLLTSWVPRMSRSPITCQHERNAHLLQEPLFQTQSCSMDSIIKFLTWFKAFLFLNYRHTN